VIVTLGVRRLCGWPPTEHRAVFQPSGVAVFAMTALRLGSTGMIGPNTLTLFPIGRPALAVGTWAGLKSFRKLNEQALRRVVLILPLASGLSLLIVRRSAPNPVRVYSWD
jgi:uncharacterized membrane protein YfcA